MYSGGRAYNLRKTNPVSTSGHVLPIHDQSDLCTYVQISTAFFIFLYTCVSPRTKDVHQHPPCETATDAHALTQTRSPSTPTSPRRATMSTVSASVTREAASLYLPVQVIPLRGVHCFLPTATACTSPSPPPPPPRHHLVVSAYPVVPSS